MHSCWCLVFLSKFDENWCCGVELCMNWCLLVDVSDLEDVVVELVLWVSRFMNWWRDFILLLKVEEVMIFWWILLCWWFNSKTCMCLSVLNLFWPINTFWNLFWWIGGLKMGFWDEFGLEPVTEFWESDVGRFRVLRTLKHPTSVPEACYSRSYWN